MNRFETLMAPPSLTSKDLRIHLRMHPEIPQDVSGQCSQELVNVSTRLIDELTTVRFGRDLAKEPEPGNYRRFIKEVTGADATPIDYKFFASYYPGDESDPRRWVNTLETKDAVQAWAAQGLRVAMSAETEDPSHAAEAWCQAVLLYQRYFAMAEVEDTYTFAQQADPSSQEACRKVWKDFLYDQVGELATRTKTYAISQQHKAFTACLAVLAVPEVARVNPTAASGVQQAAQDTLVAGIESANTLKAAEAMYSSQVASDPATREALDRSLLAAMTKEAELLEKGFGDLDCLEHCAHQVELQDRPDSKVGSLTRAARHEFYEACSRVARLATEDEVSPENKQRAARLLKLVPADWVIGTGMVGQEEITRDDAIENLLYSFLGPQILDALNELREAPIDTVEEENALKNLITFARDHPDFVSGPQTKKVVLKICSDVFQNSARVSVSQSDTARVKRMMALIADYLPEDHMIEIEDQSHSASEWVTIYASGNHPFSILEALSRLATAPSGSVSERDALKEVLKMARRDEVDSEVVDLMNDVLVKVFGGLAARYLEDPLDNARCLGTMNEVVDFLPSSTTANLGGETETLRVHKRMVQGIGAFKLANDSAVGSVEERMASASLLDVLDSGVNFDVGDTNFRERAVTILRNIQALNEANGSIETSGLITYKLGQISNIHTTVAKKPESGLKVATVVGILIGFAVLVGIMWGVWTLTAPLGRTWQVILCIVAFFLPSVLYQVVKAIRK